MSSRGKWTAYVDDSSGQTYYYNTETQESRWTAPGWIQQNPGEWVHEDTGEVRSTDPLWQVFYDDSYAAPYWYNSDTGERTWEKPAHAIAWVADEGTSRSSGTSSRALRIAAVKSASATRADGTLIKSFRRSVAVRLASGKAPVVGSGGLPAPGRSMFDAISEERAAAADSHRPPMPTVTIDDIVASENGGAMFHRLTSSSSKSPIVAAGIEPLRIRACQAGMEAGQEFKPESVDASALASSHIKALAEYRKKFLSPVALSKIAFFDGITSIEARAIAAAFTLWACPSGTPVTYQGDLQECFFVVANGSLQLYSSVLGAEVDIAVREHLDAQPAAVESANIPDVGALYVASLREGDSFGAPALVAENARSLWSCLTVASSPAGADSSMQVLTRSLGGCHLLVLSRASLHAALGHQWVLNKKLSLLTGIQGIQFAAQHASVWSATQAAATFASAAGGRATAALVRGSASSTAVSEAAEAVGSSGGNISLIASSPRAQAALHLHLVDVPFVAHLPPSELEKFSKHCVLVRRRAHAPLMIEGTPADAFIVVIHGAVRVTQQSHFVLCCGPGFYTGDVSLSKNVPSATTVVTASECLLLVVPKPSWEKYVKRNPLLPDAFAEKAVSTTELATGWRQLRVFGAMSDTQLGFMGSAARVVKLAAGQKLTLCRRRIDGCYIVKEGEVSVSIEDMKISAQAGRVIGLQNLLGTSYADAVVGEDDSACSMTIQAIGATVLLRLTRSDAVSLVGGFDASLNVVGNFEASAALLAALGNDLQMKTGKLSSPEDGVLFDVAAASVLARSARLSALMETMIQLEQSTPQPLLACAAECDFFTQRAAALSPTGAPIVSPPSLLIDYGREVYQRYLAPDASCTTVRDFVPEELRLLVGSFISASESPSGSGLTSSQVVSGSTVVPVTLFSDIVGAINLELSRMLCDLKESMALRQIIESIIKGQDNSADAGSFLDADSHSSAVDSLSKKGMIARFITSKLNRYGRWQGRVLTVRLDTSDVVVHETAGEASHKFKLASISTVERYTRDASAKQLSLRFRDEVDKDYILRFEDSATRETFCTLINLLEPSVPVVDDCVHNSGNGKITYDVLLVTRGVNTRRVLTVDTVRRVLIRARYEPPGVRTGGSKLGSAIVGASSIGSEEDGDDEEEEGFDAEDARQVVTKELAITIATRLEASPSDPMRLKLLFGSEGDTNREVFEVVFSSSGVRDHFAGTMRLLTWGVDAPPARLIGMNKSGIAPDVLSIWTGSLNVGDQKPPKDLSTWIPAHRYDMYVIGLQECNARDEWVKAIETMLFPTNAPSSATECVPFSSFGTPPAAAAAEHPDPSLAKEGKPEASTKGAGFGLFSRLRGKGADKSDKSPEEKPLPSPVSRPTAPSFSNETIPEGQTSRSELGLTETLDFIGLQRDALSGLPATTPATSKMLSLSSSSAHLGKGSDAGAASSAKVSSKASRMLGLAGGGPAALSPPSKAGLGMPGVESVQRRPDPPLNPSPHMLVSTITLWGIHLLVFARASVAEHLSNVQTSSAATGIGGVLGNKGGVGCGMVYKEATSLAFVAAHLAARPERQRERGENFADICKNLRLSTSTTPGQFLHHFDHVFFLGDLNYRIDLGNMGTPEEFHRVQSLVAAKDFAGLYAGDQLKSELEQGKVFSGFQEGKLNFFPTYRLEKHKDEYSNKRHQNPSYTDRILFRSRGVGTRDLRQLYYDATFTVNISDHRPISSGFLVASKVPYINLQRIAAVNAAIRTTCNISMCSLRYDDVVLAKQEQAHAAAGLDISSAVATIQKARTKALHSATTGEETAAPAPELTGVSHGIVSVNGTGILGSTSGVPTYVAGASSANALSGDIDALGSLRAEDYFIELTAPWAEDVSTAPGIAAGSQPTARPTAAQVANSGAVAAAVSGSSALAALAAAMDNVPAVSSTPGSLSAQWTPDMIPDLIAQLPEPRWLQDQCLVATVKRKGGAVIAHAEVPLRDAYLCMERELPMPSESLSLMAVFDHPLLARSFAAYAASRLSNENLDLYRAQIAYQELCASGLAATPHIRLVAAHSIAETFLWGDAPRMVSMSGTIIARLKAALAAADAAFGFTWAADGGDTGFSSSKLTDSHGIEQETVTADLFAEVASEAFKSMDRELMPGFRQMYASLAGSSGLAFSGVSTIFQQQASEATALHFSKLSERTKTAASTTSYAPFCVPMVRDGCTVGILRGGLMLSSLDTLGERSQRLKELQRFLRRRSSVHKMNAAGTESGTASTVALEDAPAGVLSNVGSKLGNMIFGPTTSTAAPIVAPVPALQLNNISTFVRMPTSDQAIVKRLVDDTLKPLAEGHAHASEDFLLLADIIMGSAMAEREAAPQASSPLEPRVTAAVFNRAASMAIGASSSDKSVTTRALRMVLQLALNRLAAAEALNHPTT